VKVISYSLWGDNPTYTVGAVRNADLATTLFPDWVCVFYCFESVPTGVVQELESRKNCIVRKCSGEGNRRSAFERFFPAEDPNVEYFISRDTDSRLSQREVLAVNEWMEHGTDLHIMRDHPYHGVPILAGMWGVRGGKLEGIQKFANEYSSGSDKNYKFQDQDFLSSWVWSRVQSGNLTATIHDPFFQKSSFPKGAERGEKNGGVWFVGQVFDEHDKYNSQSDLDMVIGSEYENKP